MADLDTLLAARGVPARIRPRNNRVALIGHSLMDQCLSRVYSGTANRTVLMRTLLAFYLSSVSRGRMLFPESAAFGVSGWTSTQIRTTPLTAVTAPGNPAAWGKTQVEAAIAAGVGSALVMAYHNDPGNGVDDATSRENHRLIAKQLTDAGIFVFLVSNRPVGSVDYVPQRQAGAVLRRSTGMRDYLIYDLPSQFPGQCYAVDGWTPLEDLRAAATAGDVVSAYTVDGVHGASAGDYRVARALLTAVGELFPRRPPRLGARGDDFNAADNPLGNLLKGAVMMTDAGTAMAGTTGGVTLAGVRPALWNVNTSSGLQGGTGITLTGSMRETNGERFFDLRAQGQAAAGGGNFEITPGTLTLGDLSAGDRIAAYGDFEIAQGGVGLGSFGMRLLATLPNGEFNAVSIGEADTSTKAWDSILAAERFTGTINGDVGLVVAKTETAIAPAWFCRVTPGAAFDFTLSMRRPAVRKGALA